MWPTIHVANARQAESTHERRNSVSTNPQPVHLRVIRESTDRESLTDRANFRDSYNGQPRSAGASTNKSSPSLTCEQTRQGRLRFRPTSCKQTSFLGAKGDNHPAAAPLWQFDPGRPGGYRSGLRSGSPPVSPATSIFNRQYSIMPTTSRPQQ